jgi:quinol-cytochrome oxidoreductase complex cytochrome b subunit
MKFIERVKELRLQRPVHTDFPRRESRIFFALLIIVSVFVFLAVEVGNGYQSIAVFSPNYTQTSFLWYEHGLHIAPSWTCQGAVIQRGQGLIPPFL